MVGYSNEDDMDGERKIFVRLSTEPCYGGIQVTVTSLMQCIEDILIVAQQFLDFFINDDTPVYVFVSTEPAPGDEPKVRTPCDEITVADVLYVVDVG